MRKILSILMLGICLCANAKNVYDRYYDTDDFRFGYNRDSNKCVIVSVSPNWKGGQLPSTVSFDFEYKHYNLTVTGIEDEVFRNNQMLKDLVLPRTITYIGSMAFQGSSLKTLKMSDAIYKIGDFAFRGCKKLERVILPKTKITIPKGCFASCTMLRHINLENVEEIKEMAFYNTALGAVSIPNSCTAVGDGAFSCCRFLKYLKIGEFTYTLGSQSFRINENIECVRFPDALKTIPFGCLVSDNKLEVVVIGRKTEKVEAQALFSPSLKRIYCLNPDATRIQDPSIVAPGIYDNATLYCPVGSKDGYAKRTAFAYENIVEMDMSNIDELIASYYDGMDDVSVDEIWADDLMDSNSKPVVAPGYYDLLGNRVENPQPGNIYIQCLPDGTSRKILVP